MWIKVLVSPHLTVVSVLSFQPSAVAIWILCGRHGKILMEDHVCCSGIRTILVLLYILICLSWFRWNTVSPRSMCIWWVSFIAQFPSNLLFKIFYDNTNKCILCNQSIMNGHDSRSKEMWQLSVIITIRWNKMAAAAIYKNLCCGY